MDNIIENNKLIAEFMGLKTGLQLGYDRWHSDWFDNQGVINGQRNERLEFNTSWDWLMPVFAKIWDIYGEGDKRTHEQHVAYDAVLYARQDSTEVNDVNSAFHAIVMFIQFHNTQPGT